MDRKEWKAMVRQQLRDDPPHRRKTKEYYKPPNCSTEFNHFELRSSWKRRQILALHPETIFDYSLMTEDNLQIYWYIEKPMKIFPRYWQLLVRNRAGSEFDRNGSFVQKWSSSSSLHTPPPLLLLLADHYRRQEFVNLKEQALLAVQKKYSPFETNTSLEEEEEQADNIQDENLPEFLDRMATTFITCGRLQMLSNVSV